MHLKEGFRIEDNDGKLKITSFSKYFLAILLKAESTSLEGCCPFEVTFKKN